MKTEESVKAQPNSIRLAHLSPGRIRLKIDELKHNATRAREIEDRLRPVSGIRSVEANPSTGSLIITFDEAAMESMEMPFAVAEALGISLNDLNPQDVQRLMSHHGNGSKSTDAMNADLESAVREMNAALRRTAGVDLAMAIPLGLAVMGLRSLLVAGKTAVPVWYDYLWFAFGTYFMLNRPSSSR